MLGLASTASKMALSTPACVSAAATRSGMPVRVSPMSVTIRALRSPAAWAMLPISASAPGPKVSRVEA